MRKLPLPSDEARGGPGLRRMEGTTPGHSLQGTGLGLAARPAQEVASRQEHGLPGVPLRRYGLWTHGGRRSGSAHAGPGLERDVRSTISAPYTLETAARLQLMAG